MSCSYGRTQRRMQAYNNNNGFDVENYLSLESSFVLFNICNTEGFRLKENYM